MTTKKKPAPKKKVAKKKAAKRTAVSPEVKKKKYTGKKRGPKPGTKLRKPGEPPALKNGITLKLILKTVEGCKGVIGAVCDTLKVNRSTFYNWQKEFPEVKQAIEDSVEANLDHAESKLRTLIDREELGAICFFLKCRGKQRGYVEKLEFSGDVAFTIDIEGEDK